MDERAALELLADRLPGTGDDAAVVDGLVVTTDMLHEATDFPDGTTRETAGWRALGASLSDVAAMGAAPVCALAAYAAPEFDATELGAFLDGATGVCDAVDCEYVGGDLDEHDEFTVTSTAIGRVDDPVLRSGAESGDAVCVTGTLGRSAAAFRRFETGDDDRANELYRFVPRVAAGRALAPQATAMMDSSDGLARSLHQLAEASDVGFAVEYGALPVDESVREVARDVADERALATTFGEDYELVATLPESAVGDVRDALDCGLSRVGTVTTSGVEVDGEALADEGWTHGT
jgi:thiamine-monophosphate kinase